LPAAPEHEPPVPVTDAMQPLLVILTVADALVMVLLLGVVEKFRVGVTPAG
jgi:hypothetical protein